MAAIPCLGLSLCYLRAGGRFSKNIRTQLRRDQFSCETMSLLVPVTRAEHRVFKAMKEHSVLLGVGLKKRSQVEDRKVPSLSQVSNAQVSIKQMRHTEALCKTLTHGNIRMNLRSGARGHNQELRTFLLDFVSHVDHKSFGDFPRFLPNRVAWLTVHHRVQTGFRDSIPRSDIGVGIMAI